MAMSVVSSAVKLLGDLLIQEAKFLYGVRGKVELMRNELELMQSFLQDADRWQDENESVRNWVSQIREVAYHAKDAIETFALNIESRSRRGGMPDALKRYACVCYEAEEIHKFGSEIETITTRISNLTRSLQTYGIKSRTEGEGSSSVYATQREWRQSYSHVVEEYTVGLDEDVKILVARLLNQDEPCLLVSICGMGGLGKTTLAKKIFHHKDIRRQFHGFAWAYISQQCQRRDVWEGILFELTTPSRKEIKELRDEEVARKLYQVLQEKKCLVILDDIWRSDTWDSLSPAFPTAEVGSKMLFTTQNKEVALYAHVNLRGFLHEPRCLTEDEAWELLKKKASQGNHDPDFKISEEMKKLGREMLGKCAGLPLAIIVLGGVLTTKHTLNDWKMVHENIGLHLRGKGHEHHRLEVDKVLTLSYNELPYQLKPCFLHLSQFPEDFEIPTKKLIRMWIAEGMASPMREGEETLEDVADRYLGELLDRCMIQVGARGSTGRVKTCRLHDLMRDLCLSKADEENFVKIIHLEDRNKQVSSISSACRVHRLAVYLGKEPLKSFLEQERTLYFHSLLFFSSGSGGAITSGKMISRLSDFKLLKILDMEQCWIRIPKKGEWISVKLESAIGNLIHLRYLSLNCNAVTNLPSSIDNLRCLQTLILKKNYGDQLIIPNVIWKMKQLRHLYLPIHRYRCYDKKPISRSKLLVGNLRELQTLQGFHTSDCDVKDLTKLPNLKKLGIRLERLKELVEVLRSSRVTFNSLCSLKCEYDGLYYDVKEADLQILLSGCPHLYKLYLKVGPIVKLPEYHHFPQNLTKLTLVWSQLEEDPMPTLEKLPYLSILRLRCYAFRGKKMVCSSKGFPQLKSLLLEELYSLEEWCVGEEAMPSLCQLVIEHCDELKMVPDGLRFITTLRELQFRCMPAEFKNRLRGGEDLYKVKHVPSIIFKNY